MNEGTIKKPKSENWAKRKCLRCNTIFMSWGPANRRCDTCSTTVGTNTYVEWQAWGDINFRSRK